MRDTSCTYGGNEGREEKERNEMENNIKENNLVTSGYTYIHTEKKDRF